MNTGYEKLIQNPRWLERRERLLKERGTLCEICGEHGRQAHVHHLRYEKGVLPWDSNEKDLQILCGRCHRRVHGKMNREILDSMKQSQTINLPFELGPEYKERHLAVVNLAFLLQQQVGNAPVYLPQNQIACWLNLSQRHVSAIIAVLCRRGILECTDATFSYKAGKAKEYRFVFPPKPAL